MTGIFCNKAHNLLHHLKNKLPVINHHSIRNNIPNILAYTTPITNIAIYIVVYIYICGQWLDV